MTDRELLEAAAKAAGIETHGWRAHESRPGLYMLPITETGAYVVWNPITDDGDALRLAVTLRLGIEWWKHGVSAHPPQHAPSGIQSLGTDPCAATRRAIVIAAANMAGAAQEAQT